jgi:hypothetical protein
MRPQSIIGNLPARLSYAGERLATKVAAQIFSVRMGEA